MKTIKAIIIIILLLTCSFLSAQWVKTNGPTFFEAIPVFAMGSCDSAVLACQSVNGVFKTTNNGQVWNLSLPTIHACDAIATNGALVFVGCGIVLPPPPDYTVWRSFDCGQNWDYTSLYRQSVWSIAMSGTNIFAGTDSGVFRSTNYGVSWSQTSVPYTQILSLAASGTNIFAGASGSYAGVYKSTNNGQSWVTSLGNPGSMVTSLALYSTNVYAGTNANGVYVSTNMGQNWNQYSVNSQYITSLIAIGTNVFAGTQCNGVYLSTNSGQNWSQKNEGLPGFCCVKSLLIANGYIFAGIDTVWRRPLSELITNVNLISSEVPVKNFLFQNYPNPFNPVTKIKFDIPAIHNTFLNQGVVSQNDGVVSLKIYNILGSEVVTLVNQQLKPGTYEVEWDASNYPSGVYFYQLETENFIQAKKLMLMK